MSPETREHLRRSWGFCERHAWGWLTMECSILKRFVHGPAVLYDDLIERARTSFTKPLYSLSLQHRLRTREPCRMCALGYGPQTTGYPDKRILERGHDLTNLRSFAGDTQPYWEKYACRLCLGKEEANSGLLCRYHLIEELSHRRLKHKDLDAQKHIFLDYLVPQLRTYSRSFVWEFRNTLTAEGEASLIIAIGWCCGWRELLRLLES